MYTHSSYSKILNLIDNGEKRTFAFFPDPDKEKSVVMIYQNRMFNVIDCILVFNEMGREIIWTPDNFPAEFAIHLSANGDLIWAGREKDQSKPFLSDNTGYQFVFICIVEINDSSKIPYTIISHFSSLSGYLNYAVGVTARSEQMTSLCVTEIRELRHKYLENYCEVTADENQIS